VADGGTLARKGMVEVVSSVERDGRPVFRDLRWGVYAVFEAPSDYVRDCFAQYGLKTDASGRYAAMYKPYHLIGLELGISVASIAVRHEATGATGDWRGDVAATAKRALKAGEKLDGEGGYTVHFKLMPTADSLRRRALPIGLAHDMVLLRDIAAGEVVSWDDVRQDASVQARQAVQVRREQETLFRRELGL
jgi:predicted homoserine dehydrogenase-like protein